MKQINQLKLKSKPTSPTSTPTPPHSSLQFSSEEIISILEKQLKICTERTVAFVNPSVCAFWKKLSHHTQKDLNSAKTLFSHKMKIFLAKMTIKSPIEPLNSAIDAGCLQIRFNSLSGSDSALKSLFPGGFQIKTTFSTQRDVQDHVIKLDESHWDLSSQDPINIDLPTTSAIFLRTLHRRKIVFEFSRLKRSLFVTSAIPVAKSFFTLLPFADSLESQMLLPIKTIRARSATQVSMCFLNYFQFFDFFQF